MNLNAAPSVKTCSRCLAAKPADAFYAKKQARDGLQTHCKECRSAADKERYAADRENRVAAVKKYKEANPEKAREAMRSWRERNKERMAVNSRNWYLENTERAKALSKTWVQENKERHKQVHRAKMARRRARVRGVGGSHTMEDVQNLLRSQKWRCVYCLTNLRSGYHVDHVMPLALGGSNDRSNLQCLCPTCNQRKNAKHPVAFAQELGRLL